jgi:hypothetical protein
MPGNKSNPNPPAPVDGAGAKEGEQGSINTPLPRYVITLSELGLKKWLENAKPGDRLDISSLAPPPPPPGAVEISKETKFYNFRVRYLKDKSTLVVKSGGFTVTVNPLRGIRIYKNAQIIRELSDCWASLLFSMVNKMLTEHGYNTFSEKWFTASVPENKEVRKLIALIASLINGKEKELKDPFFRACIDGGNSPKTPS